MVRLFVLRITKQRVGADVRLINYLEKSMGFFSNLFGRGRQAPATHPSDGVSSKTWQEAGDVLIEMSTFQNQLGKLYDEYRERNESPRIEMLLDLLSGRAYQCEKDLADYVQGMPRSLRQSRIQFRMTHSPRTVLGELCDLPKPTSDDITEVGLKSDDYFEAVFKELIAVADANGARRLQKVFENMWEMEQQARRTFARQIASLNDI